MKTSRKLISSVITGTQQELPNNIKEMIGQTFNDAVLDSVQFLGRRPQSHNAVYAAKCHCSLCGHKFSVLLQSLLRNGTKNHCPKCWSKERRKGTHTKERMAWTDMKRRCTLESNENYPNYGGRGIKVCERWLNNFENFFIDMGPAPKGTSLDRIDTNGNYEPGNCRWADIYTQCNNKRNNRLLEYKGIIHTAAEWGRILNMQGQSVRANATRNNGIAHLIETKIAHGFNPKKIFE